MSGHPKVWGTERFLVGLILFLVVFAMLWSYVYYQNAVGLPVVK